MIKLSKEYNDTELFLAPSEEKIIELDDIDEKDKIIVDEKTLSYEDRDVLNEYDINSDELENNSIKVDDFLEFARKHARDDVYRFIDELKKNKEKVVEKESKKDDDISHDIDNNEEDKNKDDDINEQEINLSSKTIKSRITGGEIDLTNYNVFDRIQEIYYHTGIKITVNDSLFVGECNRGVSSFNKLLNRMNEEYVIEAKTKLGPDWQQVLLKEYVASWNRIMSEEIEKEIGKGSKRREDYEKSKMEKEKEELEKKDVVTRVKVREVNKDELRDLKKDLLNARKTAILTDNGEHIIYKDGIVSKEEISDEPKYISR